MSLLNVLNIGDGTDQVPIDVVVDGTTKAWANVDGVTSTAALTGSYNCASVTDAGIGSYTLNFTSDFSDVNYGVVFGDFQAAAGTEHIKGLATNATTAPTTKTTGSMGYGGSTDYLTATAALLGTRA